MNPRSFSNPLLREAPLLRTDESVEHAVRELLASDLPALPVIDREDRLCGIFGEREFFGALFPGYLKELKYAGFVPRSLEDALEKRSSCRTDAVGKYMNTEHIDVGTDFSDAQLAEVFLHHRVLLIPSSMTAA
jgi:CBS-domain-containing membrane protein